MRKKNRLLFMFVLLAIHLHAQDNLAEKIWELSAFQVIQIDPGFTSNIAHVSQRGQSNQLVAIQQLSDVGSNAITTIQQGNYNDGYVAQNGNNQASLLIQKGNDNTANIWSLGAETQNLVFQDGNENLVNSYIKNTASLERIVSSIQQGDNNRIEVQFNDISGGLSSADIVQKGSQNVAEMVVNQFESTNIIVTQTGNPAPSVIIKQSDFSFPLK